MPDHPTDRAGRPHDGKSYIITPPSSPFTDADTAYLHGWIAGYQNGHRDGAGGLDHDVHRHVDPAHAAALAKITGRDLPTLGRPLTEVELTRLGDFLDGLRRDEWEVLRPPVTGSDLIALERERQVEEEGITAEHDSAEHFDGSLAQAARCYAQAAVATYFPDRVTFNGYRPGEGTPYDWPWLSDDWKPSGDAVRDLVRAGALIAAEIDRLNSRESTDA